MMVITHSINQVEFLYIILHGFDE